jgi:hypothetical protein
LGIGRRIDGDEDNDELSDHIPFNPDSENNLGFNRLIII